MAKDFIFTSEAVTSGHPDKLCDQISDAAIDRFLAVDPLSRVVVECATATGILFIAARFASEAVVDLPGIARGVIGRVGYRGPGFSASNCTVMTSLSEIPLAEESRIDEALLDEAALDEIAADNQVTVFGFACRQTPALMPLPLWLARRLAEQLDRVRHAGDLPVLAPDGKTQVAVEYRDRRPVRIHGITLTAAVREDAPPDGAGLRDALEAHVVKPVFAEEPLRPDEKTRFLVNPGGPFVTGGPARHAGLTGRKNAIDTYGEYARHSGAALSGKDPARIDRIGAYAARHAAKNVVAAGLAEVCEVQVSYTIGLSRPVSVEVETFGTGRLEDGEIAGRLRSCFDFRPAGVVRRFALRRLPADRDGRFYEHLAAYGHMGRSELDAPWERTEEAELLRR